MTDKKEKLQKHLLEGFGTLKHIIEVMHQSVEDWYIIDQAKSAVPNPSQGYWFVEKQTPNTDDWFPVVGHAFYNNEQQALDAVEWHKKNLTGEFRTRRYVREDKPNETSESEVPTPQTEAVNQ